MKKTISNPYASNWFKASLVAFLGLVLVALVTVSDYGMTWDETFRFKGGDANLEYYSELFKGEAPEVPNSNYPALFDLPLALFHEAFPDWGTRSQKGHVWSLCFGLLGLLATWRTAACIAGERAGFWALLLLATLPRFYGHMFFNPKDIPLAGTYAFGCWALVAFFVKLPRIGWLSVFWVGCGAGLAMSCRIAGFLILVYLGLFSAVYLFMRYLDGVRGKALLEESKALMVRCLCAGLLAFAILYLFWPALHKAPLASFFGSASDAQSFGWNAGVLVSGEVHPATDLPRSYLPYWMLRTIPEHTLFLLLTGVLIGLCHLVRNRFAWSASQLACAIVMVGGVFPVCYILWKDPVLYDGMRHLLFVLPPLTCVAALSFEWILRRLPRRFIWMGQAVMAALVGLVVVQMVSLHPYQYVYFNQITGGLQSAYLHDETDYWGLSHKEAAEWLEAHTDPGQVYTVHLRYSRYMLKEHLDPTRFRLSPVPENADFFVAITRFGFYDDYPDAKLLHVVERQGVPLCFIFELSNNAETKDK